MNHTRGQQGDRLFTKNAGWLVNLLTWPMSYGLVDPVTAYDALFYVDRVSPSTEVPLR